MSPYIAEQARKLNIGSRAEYRRDDYIMPRVRSDRDWRELTKSPPMESTVEQAVGVLLLGLSASAILYMLWRFFG